MVLAILHLIVNAVVQAVLAFILMSSFVVLVVLVCCICCPLRWLYFAGFYRTHLGKSEFYVKLTRFSNSNDTITAVSEILVMCHFFFFK
jgi:hypothetical protein